MSLTATTAVILAGGLGTRLRSVVADRPKALADVAGRPFLSHLLDHVARAGIRNVILCTGYMADQVEEAFGSTYHGLRLRYSRETTLLGTGGAVRLAVDHIQSDRVLVMNGDSYCTLDPRVFDAWHAEHSSKASIALVHVEDTARYGRVGLDPQDRILRFEEKAATFGPGWINAGMYLIDRERLRQIPADRAISLEREVFPKWTDAGLLGYRSDAELLDIGTPEAYARAADFLTRANARRAAVLDRDGTIIVERHYLSNPDDVELLPGAAEGLRTLSELGYTLIVATNQSGLSRGYFDQQRLDAIHARVAELLTAEGVQIDGIYVCPHLPEDGCACRKPAPGLFDQAAYDFGFEPRSAIVIGDKACDVDLGRAVGATTFLVLTGYGPETAQDLRTRPDFVVGDLREVARHITASGPAPAPRIRA